VVHFLQIAPEPLFIQYVERNFIRIQNEMSLVAGLSISVDHQLKFDSNDLAMRQEILSESTTAKKYFFE